MAKTNSHKPISKYIQYEKLFKYHECVCMLCYAYMNFSPMMYINENLYNLKLKTPLNFTRLLSIK